MAYYKIDGAKFDSLEELIESLWPLYRERLSREEFESYVKENLEVRE